MKETYEYFACLVKDYTGPSNIIDQASVYKQTQEQLILAQVFTTNYRLALTVTNLYPLLTEEDKASWCLAELHDSLLAYDEETKNSPLTLWISYLHRRLQSQTGYQRRDKRKANLYTYSYETQAETENDTAQPEEKVNNKGIARLTAPCDAFDEVEFLTTLDNSKDILSKKEIEYCKVFVDTSPHAPRNNEIAKAIGVSNAAVTYIKDRLQNKLPLVFPT